MTGKRRILLVEDHEDTARMLERLLEHEGYEVALAGGVGEAKTLCKAGHFDLLIADIGLPDGDGNELLRDLNDQGRIQAIAVTAYAMEADVERARKAGFVEVFVKPFDVNALRRAIGRLISSIAEVGPKPPRRRAGAMPSGDGAVGAA